MINESLLYKIYLSPFELELKRLFDQETTVFGKMNFTYQTIIVELIRVKTLDFPENLGLLFLIENYVGFFLVRKWIDGLSQAGKHNKAYKLRVKTPKSTLGVLLGNVKQYINNPKVIDGLESIIDERNKLTHNLLTASKDDKEIKKVANSLVSSIYATFDRIAPHISPNS